MFVLRQFILFLLILSVFVSTCLNSYSLDQYMVRTIYFMPTDSLDKSEQLDLNDIMKSIRLTYLNEMDRHGFPGKTFNLETDNNNKVVVHKVKGNSDKVFYKNGNTLAIVQKELEIKGYNNRQSVYAIVIAGMNILSGGAGGLAVAMPHGAWHNNSNYFGYCISTEHSKDRVEGILRHEIGHCFGLVHLVLGKPSGFIMANGDKLTFHEARWLSRNQYFNNRWMHNFGPEIIRFHGAENENDGQISITADITDPDGLFQSYGLVDTPTAAGFAVIGVNLYNGDVNEKVNFSNIDRYLLEASDKIWIQLMDIHGNWRYHHPNTYKLPDKIRKTLNKNEDIVVVEDEDLATDNDKSDNNKGDSLHFDLRNNLTITWGELKSIR